MVGKQYPNDINKQISKYCEIKQFSLQTEKNKFKANAKFIIN